MAATPEGERIDPLEPREWTPEAREALAALQPPGAARPVRAEGAPKALNLLGTLARYPALARAFYRFNGHVLYASSLTERQRELLVLRVAVLRDCAYERAQHAVLARAAGLDQREVDRVAAGPGAPGWSALEGALLQATDELVGSAQITTATWAALSAELDEHQLMDLVFTVGAYDALAMALGAFAVPLDDDLR